MFTFDLVVVVCLYWNAVLKSSLTRRAADDDEAGAQRIIVIIGCIAASHQVVVFCQAACALGAPCAEQPLERPEEGAEGEGVAADGEGAEEGDDAVDEGPEVAVASAVGLGGVWEGDGELCHNEADVNIDMGLRHGVGADSLDPDALGLATGDGAEGDGAAQQRSQHMMAK